jgi:predicted ArsR family transcriptional regulator
MLRLAVDHEQITARRAAEQLHLSRAVAGTTLRALERAGHLDGHLVGGGQIGYRLTARGRERLDADQFARGPIAAKG